MQKLSVLILFLSSTIFFYAQNNSSKYKRVFNSELSSGLISLKGVSPSNMNYRFDFGGMFILPKVNYGINYYFGFSNRTEVKYNQLEEGYFPSPNGYDYIEGYMNYQIESDLRFFNLGAYLYFNKFIVGNYFDGGLYASMGLGIDNLITRTSSTSIVSSDVVTSIPTNERFHYLSEGSIIGGSVTFKIGYDFPLSKYNLGIFTAIDKSFFAKTTTSYYFAGLDKQKESYLFLRIGIKLLLVGNVY